MTTTDTPMRNGVDTPALFALDDVKASPGVASFQFGRPTLEDVLAQIVVVGFSGHVLHDLAQGCEAKVGLPEPGAGICVHRRSCR